MNAEKSWPHKSAAELAQIITTAWDVPIIEHDLVKPTPELVQRIYSAILLDVLSLDVQKFDRDRQMVLSESGTEYTEYYYESTTMQMLLYQLGRVAKVAKVKTFTMRDLTRPDPVRINRILSAIVNFMAFGDSRGFPEFLENLYRRAETTRERYEDRREEQDTLQQEYAEERQQFEEEKQSARGIMLEIQELESELNGLIAEARQLNENVHALKARKKERSDTLQQLTTERENLVRSNAADKGRIVKSPERVKQKNANLAESAEALKPQLGGVEASVKSNQAKIHALHDVQNDVKDATKDLQLLEKDLGNLRIRDQYHHERRSNLSEKKEELKSAGTKFQHAERQRQYTLDKLQRIRGTHEEKQEIARRKHEDLQVRHQRLVKLRDERHVEHHTQKEDMDRMAKEQDAFVTENQTEVDALSTEYYKMARMIANYMFDLDKELDLQVFSNKHVLTTDDHKKHKKKKKVKVAPAPDQEE
ncbi:Nuf2 family-domain-containing protein [Cantharellus anzutake]|uniref:Nuf2 family-domain-containing protein n=1 Tax=Cantharellus anzutake TaxID=1750568 RepID=UPI0019086AAD|nr:Nuf2 family-domain-containing protein [Cantharellus anzutake]KAF8334183.1 Nuf2 family-domain-containing protein [Cantharellus anzutake]